MEKRPGTLRIWARLPLKCRCPMRNKCSRSFSLIWEGPRLSQVPGWLPGVKNTEIGRGRAFLSLYFPAKGRKVKEVRCGRQLHRFPELQPSELLISRPGAFAGGGL